MDTSNPFAPLPRGVVGYHIMRDDNSSSDNTSQTNSRWNSRLQVRNNGKGKGKGKPSKKGKTRDSNDPYRKIPDFGTAFGNARVVFFTMSQFSDSANIYRLKIPIHAICLVMSCIRPTLHLSTQGSDRFKHLIQT